MKPTEAKRIIESAILKARQDAEGITYSRLTAKTIEFQDLARTDCLFVRVHGWTPNALANDLEKLARANGFRVEFSIS